MNRSVFSCIHNHIAFSKQFFSKFTCWIITNGQLIAFRNGIFHFRTVIICIFAFNNKGFVG